MWDYTFRPVALTKTGSLSSPLSSPKFVIFDRPHCDICLSHPLDFLLSRPNPWFFWSQMYFGARFLPKLPRTLGQELLSTEKFRRSLQKWVWIMYKVNSTIWIEILLSQNNWRTLFPQTFVLARHFHKKCVCLLLCNYSYVHHSRQHQEICLF